MIDLPMVVMVVVIGGDESAGDGCDGDAMWSE
jgi:hypothetical protein